jgi:MFS transporter, SET family, sugar efflux transporter
MQDRVTAPSHVTPLLATSIFLSGMTSATTLPYAAIVGIETLGLSGAGYATLVSAGAIAGAVTSLLIRFIPDRVPDRRLLVVVLALFGMLGYGLIWVLREAWVFVLAIAVIIPFAVATFSQSFSYVRTHYDTYAPSRSEFMLSVMRTVLSASWVVVPPLAGIIAASTTVFDVYLATSAAYVGIAVIFIVLMREPTIKQTAPEAPRGETAGRLGWRVGIGLAGVLLATVALRLQGLALPLLIVSDLGGTLAEVGIVAGTAAAIEIPFMLMWVILSAGTLARKPPSRLLQ